MLEFKLIPTTILTKPKIAIVFSSIQAEPDARRGVWCGSRGLDDCFIICHTTDEAFDIAKKLNDKNATMDLMSIVVDPKIIEYLGINKPTKKANP